MTKRDRELKCGLKNLMKNTLYGERTRSFWYKKKMRFNFIIGNPPYQEMDGGYKASATPIYNLFIEISEKISKNIIFIVPSRWMTGGKGLDDFRNSMIHDHRIRRLNDFAKSCDVFNGVDIKGGVCFFYWDSEYNGKCKCTRISVNGKEESFRYLCESGDDIFIRENKLIEIKNKVWKRTNENIVCLVSFVKPYGLAGDVMNKADKYGLPLLKDNPINGGYAVYGLIDGRHRGWKYVEKNYPFPRKKGLNKYKVFVPKAHGGKTVGEKENVRILGKAEIGEPGMACSGTFLQMGPFNTEKEAKNFLKYLKSKFFRVLVSIRKQTQHAPSKVYKYVPLQDFTDNSDIDWSKSIHEIDLQLYNKYNLSDNEIKFIEKNIE